MKRAVYILLVSCITACNTSTQKQISDTGEVHYYYGEVNTTSADGTIPYGPAKHSLVKRIIDKDKKTISELVVQDGESFNTLLTQTEKENVFSATDEKNTFSGELTFNGESWKWDSWAYNIKMSDNSGTLSGEGILKSDKIETKKSFHSPDGIVQAMITEKLNEIPAEEYEKLLKEQQSHK